MMKKLVSSICIALLFGFISGSLLAQEKTLQYYNSHEKELLPDAQTSFQKGEYDRAMELCRWHYIILGDDPTANSLREKSERCDQLSKEMNASRSNGKIEEAKKIATVILSINPNDVVAKEVLSIEDPATPIRDSVVVEPPIVSDDTEATSPAVDVVDEQRQEKKRIQGISSGSISAKPENSQLYEPRTRFVVKAGASIVDLKHVSQTIAPGVAIGFYDLGGSPIGGELGAYICPGLAASVASMFGVDAAIVFRAANYIYPKISVGFFSCKSANSDTPTTGMCAGGGLTYLIGGHFSLGIGVNYYPKVSVQGTEKIPTTPGISYEFPTTIQILSGGIAPSVSLGWAF